ncbi:MAG: iron-containing alcohol dehydrogenase [Bacteroidales bacterium]|nr:iron-containing alcohol dehydrogenase [Bacteroidales bacterium]
MMNSFQFSSLPRIYFGGGEAGRLPSLIKKYGSHILLVTGGSSFIKSPRAASLMQKFSEEGISYRNVRIAGEPSQEDIDRNVQLLRAEKFDCVVGIGGGSVIDAGKALSAMAGREESVIEYLEGVGTKEHPGTKIPFIAVPTTSGTGSEATKNAVISRVGPNGFKRSLRHENFVPDIALVDPELTSTCPPSITAASGMDCFTQLMEAYLSVKSNPFTDALALEGLKAVKESLHRVVNDGSDTEARSGMSLAALISGICLANAGLGVVHGFASSLGARYSIPHGVICGTLMAASNEITVRELRRSDSGNTALKKYALLGEIFLYEKNRNESWLVDGFLEYLRKLTDELHLPLLSEAGVSESDLKAFAEITDCKNNPIKLGSGEISEILEMRF